MSAVTSEVRLPANNNNNNSISHGGVDVVAVNDPFIELDYAVSPLPAGNSFMC